MFYKPSKNLTLVIYQDQKAAKCFEMNKQQLKFVIFLIPVLLTSGLIIIFFLYAYFKNITDEMRNSGPKSFQELRSINEELIRKVHKLQQEKPAPIVMQNPTELTQTVENKAEEKAVAPANSSLLSLFSLPPQSKDLTASDHIAIDQVKVQKQDNNLIRLNFYLNNQSRDLANKLTGYLFIVLKNQSQISFYPALSMHWENQINVLAKLEEGESFNFSRMRSVQAEFRNVLTSSKEVEFAVLAFSKNGDILLNKVIKTNLP